MNPIIRNVLFVGTVEETKQPLHPDRAFGLPQAEVNLLWDHLGVGIAKLTDDISETKSNTGKQKPFKLWYQGAIAAYQKLDLLYAMQQANTQLTHPHLLIFCNSFVVCNIFSHYLFPHKISYTLGIRVPALYHLLA